MSEASKRCRQVADLVQRNLGRLLVRGVQDPRLKQINITAVEVSSDLGHAKVFFALMDESQLKEVSQSLDKAKGYFRHCLAKETELRYVPQLKFVYDVSIKHGQHLSDLISSVTKDDETEQ